MANNVRSGGRIQALAALAGGASAEAAAKAAGVSGPTIRRWLKDPEFTAEVTATRAELLDRTVGQLIDAATAAVTALRGCLEADSESVRVRAAVAILQSLVVVRETVDLEKRLAELESEKGDRA